MTVYSILFLIASLLDLVCIIAVIFVERKNPASTIAWAMVLIFVPFVGFLAYLMFGSGFHVNQKKRYALKLVSDNLYKRIISKHIEAHGECGELSGAPCARMIAYLTNAGGHYYTWDNDARIFTDGEDFFAAMMDDMRKAQRHIHLLFYIVRNDPLGREIVGILTEKARNGVEVRVIYDSLGCMLSIGRMFNELRNAGGQVEAFSPLIFHLSSHLRLNYRNHRKITVVDGLVGYVGGMNIGDEYRGRNAKLRPWRDTQLRLTGTAVNLLQERFLFDWASVRDDLINTIDIERFFPTPVEPGSIGAQIVSSGPDTVVASIKNGLLEMLYSARKNVYIQTPYFTPDDSFIDALRIAVGSGVDVRLMLPGLKDHVFVQAATYSYAWQLLELGIKVYRYRGFLHAKTMVFDGMAASIGSANIGNRSFSLNFEVTAFIYNARVARCCERIFLEDQANCDELTLQWFKDRDLFTRLSYGASRLLAPLM